MPKEITSKPKQTRKRIPRTCAQCRKRKQKCDSLKPCAVCRLRGEAELCDYEGAQPTRILDEDEDSGTPISTDELQLLRQKVEDMELAVNAIVSIQSNGVFFFFFFFFNSLSLTECNPALSLCDLMVNKSLTSNLGKDPLVVEKAFLYKSSQKVRRQFLKSEESQPVTSAQCLATCNSSGLMTYFKKPMPMEHYDDLQSRLPTKVQAELMIKIYKTHFHWLHSCLDLLKLQADLINLYRHQSQQQQDQLYSIQAGLGIGQAPIDDECRRINLLKMGWLFAIARLAIWKLDFQDCLELELPFQDEDRIVKASDWFKMSLICLKCADYETYPHLESVNCLILLLEPVFFDQPHAEISSDLSLLFDLKTKLIYLGFDLSLNRDPYVKDDSTKPVRKALTKDVADLLQRRMTWWAILSIDGVYSDLMGRMSSILGLESVDVLVPALSDTVQADESHPGCEKGCLISTAACSIKPKIRISYLSHEITRLPSQRNPLPTLDEIKQAHEDLLSLESDLNQNYKLYPTINNSIDRSRLTNCSKAKRDSIYFYMRYHYLFVKLNRGLHFMNNEVKDDNESSSNNNRSSSSSATAEKRKRKAGSSNVLNHSTIDSNVNNSNSHGNSIKSNSSVLNSINPFHRSCVVDHAREFYFFYY
ncbi:hypothetical protein BY996DRAFT_4573540 [Phakopsora pachyrhizi]|nr:hypothetical protein BY996DRAFT_4573540 [Phakopsora pachyrhizi]